MRLGSSQRSALVGPRWWGVYLAVCCVTLAWCVSADAQSYRELSIGQYAQLKTLRSAKSTKGGVLKGTVPLATGGDEMKSYYTRYLFPAMTRTDHRDKLADLRNEVITDLAQAKNPPARAAAYDVILRTSKALAKSADYHPATRYNALLLLGQLNKTEAIDSRPPLPDPSVLVNLIGPFRSENSPPMLRYAAILGLLRHAELCGPLNCPASFKPRVRAGLAKILLPVIQDKQSPEGVDEQAHDWLRSRAVEVVGHLRLKGEPDVVGPLAQLLVDEHEDLDLRCAAAEALGRMANALDPARAEEMTGRIAKLIVDCSNAEAHDLYEILVGPRGGRGGVRREGEGYAPPPRSRRREGELPDLENTRRRGALTEEDVADKRTLPSRRRHLFQLLTIKRGLEGDVRNGIDGIIKLPGAEAYVKPVLRLVDKMIEDLQDVETDVKQLGQKLQKSRKALLAMIPESLGQVQDEGEDLEAAAAAAEAAEDPADVAADGAEEAEQVTETAAEGEAGP